MTYAYLTVMAGLALAILRIIPTRAEIQSATAGASIRPAPPAHVPESPVVVTDYRQTAPADLRSLVADALEVETARLLESFDDLSTADATDPYDDPHFWGPYLLTMDDAHKVFSTHLAVAQFRLLDDNNSARIQRYRSAHRPEGSAQWTKT